MELPAPEEEADVKPEAEPKAEEEPASRLAYFHDPLIAIHASPEAFLVKPHILRCELHRAAIGACRLRSAAQPPARLSSPPAPRPQTRARCVCTHAGWRTS